MTNKDQGLPSAGTAWTRRLRELKERWRKRCLAAEIRVKHLEKETAILRERVVNGERAFDAAVLAATAIADKDDAEITYLKSCFCDCGGPHYCESELASRAEPRAAAPEAVSAPAAPQVSAAIAAKEEAK